MTLHDGEMLYPPMAGYKTAYQRAREKRTPQMQVRIAKIAKDYLRKLGGHHLPARLRASGRELGKTLA